MPAFASPSRTRRTLLCTAAAAAVLGLATGPLAAQEAAFPAKPIRFVVPYAPGGTTDLVARTVGAHMAQTLGQPVIIDNRAGAGGNIGMDAVAKAAPDGYTVGMGAISTNALNPHIYKKMPFDPRKDFSAVGLLGNSTIVLEAGPALPVKNVAELLAYLRKTPGTPYATAGAGTSMHLAGVLFAQLSKTDLVHVPYKGSAPLITDLIGGQVPMAFDNLPASLPHIQAGKLRALAVAGAQRSAALPDVPTLAEAGLPGYAVEPWFGVYGPAGLPAPVVQRLNKALADALTDPAVKDRLLAAGFTPRSTSAADFDALTKRDYERLGQVARGAQMSAD
ncbi:Bug family tripartite tricarboxylate transporter substrate binding protein [Paracidovorax valerianellae]|uniref:Tripartite-type tricarboxylate transporter, receptor component TctC n=1 Tax=Paracidovorax valerianellae TaxID=187868 RepID=A0A1G6XVN6_9BURK|nr:tripartite tricarboxylate transporter substrate binding protein [Paracidovorax valerianellae]MDA8443555.1 tripartite tricarboxylate transporter substrate binding protein [Paracidovorax valerianellae]SDD81487.1 Tripartite-type tricarboxylate transporter, receptor component TctC [Paracidovorax valerianellae]